MYEIDSMSRLAKYFKLKTISIINEKFQDHIHFLMKLSTSMFFCGILPREVLNNH